ncbi:hypothetical protein Cs308_0218 [Candidatus Chlamydia sanziniae]|uniref:Type I restriction enzyme R protein N-terminal domain-containing protein n=1 Tax=Candidatus Chlamydia sanziniae TaxID=1806891 RepID=A0A1A9HTS1_9CHLA|nr:hypothetical protein Cs308_0218 [Candidatus Chlamydia sanziniae]
MSATPEEIVRQKLLNLLINTLHYPQKLIVIEKELKTLLPILTGNKLRLPKRRPDILVLTPPTYTDARNITHKLGNPKPLLLIECKARVINQNTLMQLLSYNYIIGAPCLAIASSKKQLTGLVNPKTQTLDFYPGLPEYSQLLNYYCLPSSRN